jgi:putative FmdB family regulatory protein
MSGDALGLRSRGLRVISRMLGLLQGPSGRSPPHAINPMPTYEYLCEKCGLEFEHFQSMKDDAFTVCPKEVCPAKRWAKGKVKRAIGSGAGLIFKGSGFYITDYRSDNYKSAASKDKPSSDSAKESKKTKADSKAKKKA